MKVIYILLVSLFFITFISCTNNNENNLKKNESLKISDFEELKVGESFEMIVEKFGDSYDDIGSGLHILVYNFDDNSIILNFSPDNKLTKVTLKSKNKLNKVLLGE